MQELARQYYLELPGLDSFWSEEEEVQWWGYGRLSSE